MPSPALLRPDAARATGPSTGADGDAGVTLDRLTAQCYAELRAIARRERRRGGGPVTLDTGGVLHEAFLRLAAQRQAAWGGRMPFLAAAAGAMRRVVVDYARRRRAAKRGGARPWVTLDDAVAGPGALDAARDDALLALDDALARLGALAPRLARVVECRYFAGMTEAQAAAALGVTERDPRAGAAALGGAAAAGVVHHHAALGGAP